MSVSHSVSCNIEADQLRIKQAEQKRKAKPVFSRQRLYSDVGRIEGNEHSHRQQRTRIAFHFDADQRLQPADDHYSQKCYANT